MSDLLLFRAATVVQRGGEGDVWDFKWLLSEVAGRAVDFPFVCDDELGCLVEAAELCLGTGGWLVIVALLGDKNIVGWRRLLALSS